MANDKPPVIIVPGFAQSPHLNIDKPKVCLSFGASPLYKLQLQAFNSIWPTSPVYYVGNAQDTNYYQDLKSVAHVIENEHPSNTGYEISLALEESPQDSDCLIVYGSLYFQATAFRNIVGSGTQRGFLVRDIAHCMDDSEVGIIDNKGVANHLAYSSPNKWCGVFYLKAEDRETFHDIAQLKPQLFGSEVINKLIKMGVTYDIIDNPKNNMLVKIDSDKDYLRARKMLAQQENLAFWDF